MTEPQPNDRLHEALALEELIRANAESNATMAALVERVQEETKARDRKLEQLAKNNREMHRLGWLIVVSMALLLVMAAINAFNIGQARKNAGVTAKIARDTRSTNQTLLDCLNAAGQCGKQNAQQQKTILDEIKKYELTVIYCARTNPQQVDATGGKFIACVDRLYPGGPDLNGR